MDRPDITPTVDFTIQEAMEELTGFETIAIQKRFGNEIEKLGGVITMIALVWAFENRRAKVDWGTVERKTLRELNGYFAKADDPDVVEGKDEPPAS
ncbi:MAG TPA: hypothetical protein VK453_24315 [Micromonosporaceae bacterium]|nr:hypothetical protein [Micromonosporaceae bacterium]